MEAGRGSDRAGASARTAEAGARTSHARARVFAHGKAFSCDGAPFTFRGVRGEIDPGEAVAAGFTVIVVPPGRGPDGAGGDTAAGASPAGELRALVELPDVDLVTVASAPRRERSRLLHMLGLRIGRDLQPWRGHDALFGVVLGGRGIGAATRHQAEVARRTAGELAATVRAEHPGALVAWRGYWPAEIDCPEELDFLLVEYALAGPDELGPALLASHGAVGDRPLVARRRVDGRRVARLRTAHRHRARGRRRRHDRAAPGRLRCRARGVNRRTVRDLEAEWPSISVVVNAYNSESTIRECLEPLRAARLPGSRGDRHRRRVDRPTASIAAAEFRRA